LFTKLSVNMSTGFSQHDGVFLDDEGLIAGVHPDSGFHGHREPADESGGYRRVLLAATDADKTWARQALAKLGVDTATEGGGQMGIARLRRLIFTSRHDALDFSEGSWDLSDVAHDVVSARLRKSLVEVPGDEGEARELLLAVRLAALRARSYEDVEGLEGEDLVLALRARGCPATAGNAADLLAQVTEVTRHSLISSCFGTDPWADIVLATLGPVEPLLERVQARAVVDLLMRVPPSARAEWDEPGVAQTELIAEALAALASDIQPPDAVEELLQGATAADVLDVARYFKLAGAEWSAVREQVAVVLRAVQAAKPVAVRRVLATSNWRLRCRALQSLAAPAPSPAAGNQLARAPAPATPMGVVHRMMVDIGVDAGVVAAADNAALSPAYLRGLLLDPKVGVQFLVDDHRLTKVQAMTLLGRARGELELGQEVASAGGGAAGAAASAGGGHALAVAMRSDAATLQVQQLLRDEQSMPGHGEFLALVHAALFSVVELRPLVFAQGGSREAMDLKHRIEQRMVAIMDQTRAGGNILAQRLPVIPKLAKAVRSEQLHDFVAKGGLKDLVKDINPRFAARGAFLWPTDCGTLGFVLRIIEAAFAPLYGGVRESGFHEFTLLLVNLCQEAVGREAVLSMIPPLAQRIWWQFRVDCERALLVRADGVGAPRLMPGTDDVVAHVQAIRNQLAVERSISAVSPAAANGVDPASLLAIFVNLPWVKKSRQDVFSVLSSAAQTKLRDAWLRAHPADCFHKEVFGSCARANCDRC
jgi:hypothetical protein